MAERYLVEQFRSESRVLVAEAYFDLDQLSIMREWMDAQEGDRSQFVITKITVCPHGIKPEDCNDCAVDSDHAYDAAREDRFFGRGR